MAGRTGRRRTRVCAGYVAWLWVVALSFVFPCGAASAGEIGHYVEGIEGLKCGSLPPPGLYFRQYNVFYSADTFKDAHGNKLKLGFDLDVFASAQRAIWITNTNILGANYGMDVIVPLQDTNLEFHSLGLDDNHGGLGDLAFEPLLLAWHGKQWDLSLGWAFYAPTGNFVKSDLVNPGEDFWTYMFTYGGTYYLDKEKTWSASILGRYEIHSPHADRDIRTGDDAHFEYGFGKELGKGFGAGVVGYCHWQVTDDKGKEAVNPNVHDRVFAIGPEITYSDLKHMLFLSVRHEWEMGARDRPEGQITVFTLTKRF